LVNKFDLFSRYSNKQTNDKRYPLTRLLPTFFRMPCPLSDVRDEIPVYETWADVVLADVSDTNIWSVQRVNQFIELERGGTTREEIDDPLYESLLADSQPFDIRNGTSIGYSGPGKIMDGFFFPPLSWIYPKTDLEKIWCHIDTIEKGYSRQYKIEYYKGDKHKKNPVGIVFF
jgi:hypothetical protein